MNDRHPREEDLELAALYALGVLDGVEAGRFEAHLAEGCRACEQEVSSFRAVVGSLGHTVPPVQPRPELRERLLGCLAGAGAALSIVSAAAGEWQTGAVPGVRLRSLFRDERRQRFTALARLEAGSRYPAHRHAGTEELFVLDGDLVVDGQILGAGDYCAAMAGTVHDETTTRGGCTFLLLASERDEPGIEVPPRPRPPGGLVIVHADEGVWRESGVEGVSVRRLFVDSERATTTSVVRMGAGTRLPRHRHAGAEEFYVIEGEATLGGHRLCAGDYGRAAARTVHDAAFAESGCRFLLISSGAEALF